MRDNRRLVMAVLLAFAVGLVTVLLMERDTANAAAGSWKGDAVISELPAASSTNPPGLKPIPFVSGRTVRFLDAKSRNPVAGFRAVSGDRFWVSDARGSCLIPDGVEFTASMEGYESVGPIVLLKDLDIAVHLANSTRTVTLSVQFMDGTPAPSIQVGAFRDPDEISIQSNDTDDESSAGGAGVTAITDDLGNVQLSVPADSVSWIEVVDPRYFLVSLKPVPLDVRTDSAVIRIGSMMVGAILFKNVCEHGYYTEPVGMGFTKQEGFELSAQRGPYLQARRGRVRSMVLDQLKDAIPENLKEPPLIILGIETQHMPLASGQCLMLPVNIHQDSRSYQPVDVLISRAKDWRPDFVSVIGEGVSSCHGHSRVRVSSSRDVMLVREERRNLYAGEGPDYTDAEGRKVFENVTPGRYLLVTNHVLQLKTGPSGGLSLSLKDGDDLLVTEQMLEEALPPTVDVRFEVVREKQDPSEWALSIVRHGGHAMAAYSSDCYGDHFTGTFEPGRYRYTFFRVTGTAREMMDPIVQVEWLVEVAPKDQVVRLSIGP